MGDQGRPEYAPVDKAALTKYLKDSSNIVTDEVRRLFDTVLSDHHEVYVKELAFYRLGEVKANKDDCHQGKTTFVSMMNHKLYKGWNSCTIISADLNLSLFKHWHLNTFRFSRNDSLYYRLNNGGQHPKPWIDRTEFLYLIHPDEKAGLVSKFWLEANGGKNGKALDSRLSNEFGTEPLLLCTNVSRSKRKFARQSNVTTITSKDIGVNEYAEFTNVVIDAALNLSPEAESIMNMLGVPVEVLRLENIFNTAYQVVSRSNLRTNRKGEPVKLCFADKSTCDYVMTRFASEVEQVAKVRHISDQSCNEVKVVPLVPPVEYSKRFINKMNRVRRMANWRRRGTNKVFQHRLEHLPVRPSEASCEARADSCSLTFGSAPFASLGDTPSLAGSEMDSTGSNSEMVKNDGSIYIKPP